MKTLLTIVLLATKAGALIVFNNSMLIGQNDLEDTSGSSSEGCFLSKAVQFPCPDPGCTVYTTKMILDYVGVYDNDTLLITLKQIYWKKREDNYLLGLHLDVPGTEYSIRASDDYCFQAFYVYIVEDIAGPGNVLDFGSSYMLNIDAPGKQIVTVLNTKNELTFGKYYGSAPPMIYAVGHDSIDTCLPVYNASSIDNAFQSEICVFSGIATVDFGTDDANNHYHVVNSASRSVSTVEGQSVIAMSPGYTGCPGFPYKKSRSKIMTRYNFQYWSPNRQDEQSKSIAIDGFSDESRITATINDMYIGMVSKLVLSMVDYRGRLPMPLNGTDPWIHHFENTTEEVNLIFDPMETNDYFQVQVDFFGPEIVEPDNTGKIVLFSILGIAGFAVIIVSLVIAIRRARAHRSQEFSSKFLSEFNVRKIRGVGGFGCVFEVMNKYDKGVYAVKRIAVKESDIETALGEVRAMALLAHPHIVRYNSTWVEQPPLGWQDNADAELLRVIGTKTTLMNFEEDSVFIYVQMQLCNYSLSDWLENHQQPSSRPLKRMKSWFKQIVSAVDYIHEKNIIHRDLKPSNILFAEKDLLKLCDLGIATERKPINQPLVEAIERIFEDETDTVATRTTVGTALYMSQEQRIPISRYSSKSDVFTLGLILTELCVVMTETTRSEIFNNFRRGKQCEYIKDQKTAEFIQMMTESDPMDRPTCKQLLDHPFIL